jgi:hypothetical protein
MMSGLRFDICNERLNSGMGLSQGFGLTFLLFPLRTRETLNAGTNPDEAKFYANVVKIVVLKTDHRRFVGLFLIATFAASLCGFFRGPISWMNGWDPKPAIGVKRWYDDEVDMRAGLVEMFDNALQIVAPLTPRPDEGLIAPLLIVLQLLRVVVDFDDKLRPRGDPDDDHRSVAAQFIAPFVHGEAGAFIRQSEGLLVIARDGKIAALYVYLDSPPT